MEPVSLRLKALRNSVTPHFSSRAMADALEMPHSTYAGYEDPKKFKKPILPFDLAKRIANVLAEKGGDYDAVMELAGLTTSERSRMAEPAKQTLIVSGAVAAGVWREQSDWPPDERYPLEVGPSRIRGAERFAVRMEGLSMNKIVPPGSDLECFRVSYGFIEPVPGDLVIVERHAHDLTEMTCKRLARDGDEWVLKAESTEDEFKEDIRLGKPDRSLYVDNEIKVIGILIKAHQDHFRPR